MAVVEVSDDRLNSRDLRDVRRPLCFSLTIAPVSCVERIPDFNTWLGSISQKRNQREGSLTAAQTSPSQDVKRSSPTTNNNNNV